MRLFWITLFVSTLGSACAQTLTFLPSADYQGLVDWDMYTEHYVYVGHDAVDSAYVSWRVIENTCPSGWDFQLCDWQHCYSGMPNTGNMNAIPSGGQGYLRLIVNPYLIPGEGIVHFWVFPTGDMDAYTDVYVHLGTPLSVSEESRIPYVTATSESIRFHEITTGTASLYNLCGQCVLTAPIAPQTCLDWSFLPQGMYVLHAPELRTTILKP